MLWRSNLAANLITVLILVVVGCAKPFWSRRYFASRVPGQPMSHLEHHNNNNNTPTSTRDNSTTMDLIQAAIEAIESRLKSTVTSWVRLSLLHFLITHTYI
jgi:hypothetical protein